MGKRKKRAPRARTRPLAAAHAARPSAAPSVSWLASLHPKRFFLETWQRADAEADAERASRRERGLGYDYRPVWLLCVGAALLAIKARYGGAAEFEQLVHWMAEGAAPGSFWIRLPESPWYTLAGHAWWAGFRVLAYFLLPAVFIRVVLRERVREHGLRRGGLREELPFLALALGGVLVLVLLASQSAAFTAKYPFYRLARRSGADLLAWELLYVAQFFSLEFFFRGHWLTVLRRSFGSYAIFIMVVPYCMVHFGKPLPETLGAILAGVFLGTLALRTRSIWTGFLIHASVGIAMDVASIVATGRFPAHFWPT
ncbi:MAG: CPBP family intramembrane metalloprotease [Deltaproteobacteria bacterium]|nr:CPBP family intramembrane metalloprotease [Deltaproteobacteria bacterium]